MSHDDFMPAYPHKEQYSTSAASPGCLHRLLLRMPMIGREWASDRRQRLLASAALGRRHASHRPRGQLKAPRPLRLEMTSFIVSVRGCTSRHFESAGGQWGLGLCCLGVLSWLAYLPAEWLTVGPAHRMSGRKMFHDDLDDWLIWLPAWLTGLLAFTITVAC